MKEGHSHDGGVFLAHFRHHDEGDGDWMQDIRKPAVPRLGLVRLLCKEEGPLNEIAVFVSEGLRQRLEQFVVRIENHFFVCHGLVPPLLI